MRLTDGGRIGSLLASLLLAGAGPAAAAAADRVDGVAARRAIDDVYAKEARGVEAIYRDLHAHPELGFHEVRTAALLAKEMRATGFEVTEKFGGSTGLVAILRNGDGPTVLVRTELDGLPMEEKTGLAYASRARVPAGDMQPPGQSAVGGKADATVPTDHSCGHDVHMAWWLGTARTLARMKDRWRGTLMFVAEPAEEIGGGATEMLKAHLYTRFPRPAVAFAAHVGPSRAGTIEAKAGAVTSNSDTFEILFKGRGGHGSAPQATIDPIIVAARFVMDVQAVVTRQKAPADAGVISVGSFQAGTTGNIIPDSAVVKLTMRSSRPETRELFMKGMHRVARASAAMADAPEPVFTRIGGGATAVQNDQALLQRQAPMLRAAFGDDITFAGADAPASSGAETFAEFLDAGVPGIFYWIGGGDRDAIARGEAVPGNHSPQFAPQYAPAIRSGVAVLTLAVLDAAPAGAR